MNKNEFLSTMKAHLSSLPPEEQVELMEDYESHFVFGLQNGKTEAEIANELGDPFELAEEVLGDRVVPNRTLYWTNPEQDALIGASAPLPKRGPFMITVTLIALFFINIMVVPLTLGLWSVWLGIGAVAITSIASPLLLLLDTMITGSFYLSKGFVAIIFVGIGIIVMYGTVQMAKGLWKFSFSYWKWNISKVTGGVRS